MILDSVRTTSNTMRRVVQLLDISIIITAGHLSFFLRFIEVPGNLPAPYISLVLSGSLFFLLFSSYIYRSWRGGALAAMFLRVMAAWVITWLALLSWLVLTKSGNDYSRIWLTTWAGLSLVGLWIERALIYWILGYLRKRGLNHLKVILVGDGATISEVQERVKLSSWSGFIIVKVLPWAHYEQLGTLIEATGASEVWIADNGDNLYSFRRLMDLLRHSTVNIRLIPDFFTFRLMNHGVSIVMGLPMLDISSSPMTGLNLVLKFIEDRLLGAVILLLISPLMMVVAIGVKLSSPGPILFKQRRHGWNGSEIWIYKFRSMKVHSEMDGLLTQASMQDDRITSFGRFIRSTSLDELPQFINVIQGRMSIVGPRPHAVEHNHQYKELIPKYMLRHKVKPGITGWAQVNGFRGETDTLDKMEKRIEYDLYYIEHWSVWFDLKIILLTVFKGFVHKNAY